MVIWDEDNAAHLLSRAGFGGHANEIRSFSRKGQERSVEGLLKWRPVRQRGPGLHDNDPEAFDELQTWWLKRMVKATSTRLQEKMTLFWHDHFATSWSDVKSNLYMSIQNQTFRNFGMGSFRELVRQVTKDPAMLDFLDGNRNTKTRPNENYGRELQELFALGVTDLDGNPNYTETDVQQMAKSLTGYVIDTNLNIGVLDSSRWDNGSKTLFSGKPYQATGVLGLEDGSGNMLPAAQNVIDILFAHTDTDGELTMPRFLAKKLWEYFAYPLPEVPALPATKALLDDITQDFIANGFVITDLLRSMFMHDEFYSEKAKTSSVKNPAEYVVSAIRATRSRTDATPLGDQLAEMGMRLFDPPGVNGWSNGFAWLSSGQFLARLEFAQALAAGRDSALRLSPTRIFKRNSTSAAEVVDSILAKLGIAGRTPTGSRQALIDYIGPITDFTTETAIEQKGRSAIALALDLPAFHIH